MTDDDDAIELLTQAAHMVLKAGEIMPLPSLHGPDAREFTHEAAVGIASAIGVLLAERQTRGGDR